MRSLFLCCLAIFGGVSHAKTTSQFVGTVTAMRPLAAEIVVKPDKGDVVEVKVSAATMFAAEITKRDEADRLDWIKRGASGIVRERKGETVTLGIKGPRANPH